MKKGLILFSLVILGISSFCQTNFDGTWKISSKQYLKGPQYVNAFPEKIKISRTKDSLIIESSSLAQDGNLTTAFFSFALDGKESYGVSKSNRKYRTKLEWKDNMKALTLTTIFSTPENENEVDFTRIETLTLSEDGTRLNAQRQGVHPKAESWEAKGIFEKQG